MTSDITKPGAIGGAPATTASQTSGSDKTAAAAQKALGGLTKNQQLGQNEFLQLLVTQLKNQDPMDPMDSQQFAVNLAQFSQLEQLVSINDKIGKTGSSGGDFSSLASYLGHQVTYKSDSVHVDNNDGGQLQLTLDQDAANVEVQLIDGNGAVRDSVDFKDLKSGKQTVSLNQLHVGTGDFKIAVKGLGVNGETINPAVQLTGLVSGFVPGDDPSLMVGGKEIKPADVTEVTLPK